MQFPASFLKKFWSYLEFYPDIDEPDYDGEHDGGIKGIRVDAPQSAKSAFAEYMKILDEAREEGLAC